MLSQDITQSSSVKIQVCKMRLNTQFKGDEQSKFLERVIVWIYENEQSKFWWWSRALHSEFVKVKQFKLKAFHTRHTQLSGILKSEVNWASSRSPELKTKSHKFDVIYSSPEL